MSTRETPSLIDRRNVLKLLGAAGTWSALVPTMAAAQSDISRFRIRVSDDDLADLRRRLTNVRWPVEATGEPWAMGTDLAYLKQLVTYWRDKYQWRVHEAALNAFDHYVTTIDGQLIHFVHQKSRHPNATPLVMTHGWPGTFWEMLPSISALVDPTAHGGAATDAFDVIVPSIPGFGFSGSPPEGGTAERTTRLWVALMDKLGYKRFGAYGSDWGFEITLLLGMRYPERLIGTAIPGSPPRANREPGTDEERTYVTDLARWNAEERGYQFIQGSKPQTLAYGLTDSPAGLAAWIVEKLRTWSDCDGDVESRFTKDQILTLVSIYWHTRTIGTSARYYYFTGRWRTPTGVTPAGSAQVRSQPSSDVAPRAYFDFPGIKGQRVPKSFVDTLADSVKLWTYHEKGGHFPAAEEPKLLVDDLRTFFRPMRSAT